MRWENSIKVIYNNETEILENMKDFYGQAEWLEITTDHLAELILGRVLYYEDVDMIVCIKLSEK